MNYTNIRAQVAFVNSTFDITGAVSPVVHLYQPIHVGNRSFDTIDLQFIGSFQTDTIGNDDIITLGIPDDINLPVTLGVNTIGSSQRIPIHPDYCPVCGMPLFPAANGFKRCINRKCRAQLPLNLRILLGTLGVTKLPELGQVYNSIISCNTFTSPTDIFKLENDDFKNDLSQEEICKFQQTLHMIRGHVGFSHVIVALNIPDWNWREAAIMQNYATKNKWQLTDIHNFTIPEHMNNLNSINWEPWKEFHQLKSNYQYMQELAAILAK